MRMSKTIIIPVLIALYCIISKSTGQSKRSCGTNTWCYDVDLYPSPGIETSQLIHVTNGDENAITYHKINTTINSNSCYSPSITVIYEEIDFDGTEANEHLDILNNAGSLIRRCTTGRNACNSWATCLSSQSLGITQIQTGDSYLITIVEPALNDNLCTSYHQYSINLKLTFFCAASSPKTSCGTNTWCYYVDLYPVKGVETSQIINVANPDENAVTYHKIYTTIKDKTCYDPFISMGYERIDYDSASEYFDVFNDGGSLIQRCGAGATSNGCQLWNQCISDQSLGVSEIQIGDTYLITMAESASVDAFCTAYHPNSINAILTFTCDVGPTIHPSMEPTSNPTTNPSAPPTIQVCSQQDIGSFNWETLVEDSVDVPQFELIEFNVSEVSLTLDIMVELEYLGSVMSDNDDDEANHGVTYVLDFENYNSHKNKINEPGSCQNRNGSDFNDSSLSFADYWSYSDQPLRDNVGTNAYLAYPPPGDDWSVYMKDSDRCGTIVYEAHFSWNDLVSCTSSDGSMNYISTTDNGDKITLDGVFYIDIVSPLSSEFDTGYYRVYELLSLPFSITITKSIYVFGSVGINIFTMTIISVNKQDNDNTFSLFLLTESAEYLQLKRKNESLYIFQSANNSTLIKTGDFTVPLLPMTANEGCINTKAFICSQIWEIKAENVVCDEDEGIDFSGDYTLQFMPECRNSSVIGSDLNQYCVGWLLDHSDIANGVDLQSSLTWKDEVCDPLIFDIPFEATMNFYVDENYKIPAAQGPLYKAGEDRIYAEIVTTSPSDSYSVYDASLVNVWICTFDPLQQNTSFTVEQQSNGLGGCLSANRDGGNDTSDNPYFYHIYSVDGPIMDQGFELRMNDTIYNQIQFSFIVQSKISRDKLYIHAQVEIILINKDGSNGQRRRLLASDSYPKATQMDHFIANVGIDTKSQSEIELASETKAEHWMIATVVIGCLLFISLLIMSILTMICYKKYKFHGESKRKRLQNLHSISEVDNIDDTNNTEVEALQSET